MTTDAQKKQQKQLVLLAAVVLITLAILLFSRKGKNTEPNNLISSQEVLEAGISSPLSAGQIQEVDTDILFSRAFERLERNGEYPINTGKTGRKNPFIPYEEGSVNE